MPTADVALSPIPARLVSLIDADGRTDGAIARAAGLTAQYVSDIRRGRKWASVLPPDKLVALARAVGLSAPAAGRLLYECYPEKISGKNPGIV